MDEKEELQLQPGHSQELQPGHSLELQRGHSQELQRGYSGELQRGYSGELQRGYSQELKRVYSGELQPSYSPDLSSRSERSPRSARVLFKDRRPKSSSDLNQEREHGLGRRSHSSLRSILSGQRKNLNLTKSLFDKEHIGDHENH